MDSVENFALHLLVPLAKLREVPTRASERSKIGMFCKTQQIREFVLQNRNMSNSMM